MSTSLIIYEDAKVDNFYPLTHFRPVYELKCGINTISQKIKRCYSKAEVFYSMREYLTPHFNKKYSENRVNKIPETDILFINGRILANSKLKKQIPLNGDEAVYIQENEIIAFRLKAGNPLVKKIKPEKLRLNFFKGVKQIETDIKLLNYPWELILNLSAELRADFEKNYSGKGTKFKSSGIYLMNNSEIYIGKKVNIYPNVILDACEGPIVIEDGVKIYPNTTIIGPVFIGKNSVVKANSAIYQNTSIGEFCKIGGEIEDSIIHAYSNKQHLGFLGHSYLGEWVNIGAATNNSDLKNNYSNITVYINGKLVDTGMQFLGLIMGDHSKTAINTMFNTGTIVGVSSNIFGAGFPKRYIPSFSFGGSDYLRTNNLEKSMEVAKLVMQRRNVEFDDSVAKIFHEAFKKTMKERESF